MARITGQLSSILTLIPLNIRLSSTISLEKQMSIEATEQPQMSFCTGNSAHMNSQCELIPAMSSEYRNWPSTKRKQKKPKPNKKNQQKKKNQQQEKQQLWKADYFGISEQQNRTWLIIKVSYSITEFLIFLYFLTSWNGDQLRNQGSLRLRIRYNICYFAALSWKVKAKQHSWLCSDKREKRIKSLNYKNNFRRPSEW